MFVDLTMSGVKNMIHGVDLEKMKACVVPSRCIGISMRFGSWLEPVIRTANCRKW